MRKLKRLTDTSMILAALFLTISTFLLLAGYELYSLELSLLSLISSFVVLVLNNEMAKKIRYEAQRRIDIKHNEIIKELIKEINELKIMENKNNDK